MRGRKSTTPLVGDSTNSERPKHPVGDNDNDNDRISDLPDSILGNILSLLPTKKAVVTRLLSKRWELLWTTAVNLDFYFPDWERTKKDEFVRFVNYVLLLHEPGYLNRFFLKWERECDPGYFNTWIGYAVNMNVHEIIARVEFSEKLIQVPTRLFSSERLQLLDLKGNICISSETAVSFPRLKRICLDSVYFRSAEAFRKLLLGCPVLKYLFGRLVRIADGVRCIISSTSLKRVHLYASALRGGVTLDAPSLEYIKLDKIKSIMVQSRLNFLGEAKIKLTPFAYETEDYVDHDYEYDDETQDPDPKYCNSFVEAIHSLCCAKTLKLSGKAITALSRASIKMETEFTRLTRLEVETDWKYCSSIQDLIELSDNLEVLIINKNKYYYGDEGNVDNSIWREPNVVPSCLSNSLKAIYIARYNNHPHTLALVKYALEHGTLLEIMQICFSITYGGRKNELIQEISKFPRKSTICEVKLIR